MMRHSQRAPSDLFPFLDVEEQSRLGPGQGQGQSNVRLDWPAHAQGQQPPSAGEHPFRGVLVSSVMYLSYFILGSGISPDPLPSSNSDNTWLDFLSGNGAKTSGGGQLSGPGREAVLAGGDGGGRRSSSGRTSAVASPRPRTGGEADAGGSRGGSEGVRGVDEGERGDGEVGGEGRDGVGGMGRKVNGNGNGIGVGSGGEGNDGVHAKLKGEGL